MSGFNGNPRSPLEISSNESYYKHYFLIANILVEVLPALLVVSSRHLNVN